jgi:hypothetical protein
MSEPQIPPMPDGPGVRALKYVVIGMGVLIVLGVLTVIGRIVYLANQGPKQASIATSNARLAPAAKLALPSQAHVKHISMFGDRLAVHYESPAGSAVAIVDLASGNVLSRVDLVTEVPR